MKVIPLEDTDLTLPDAATLAKHGTIILTRKGRPLAAIKAISGSDWESLSLANNPRFGALIEESRRLYREEGGISLEELRDELGLKPPRTANRKKKSHKEHRS
jgi:hypothetical protein